jgi:hypothetical protein
MAEPVGLATGIAARQLQYRLDVDTDGRVTHKDAQQSSESKASLRLAGRTSMDHAALKKWVDTYDKNHSGKLEVPELTSLNNALERMAKVVGRPTGPFPEPPSVFPIALAARKFMYGMDSNYNGRIDAKDASSDARAALELAGKPSLTMTQLRTWLKTFDGADDSPKDGTLDEVEERRVFWELQKMAEHIDPENTSLTLKEWANIFIERSDANKDGKLSVADNLGKDRNGDGNVDIRDVSLQARTLMRMSRAAVADTAAIAKMLENFDIFDARTREYGPGNSDGRIGQIEYPMIDQTAVFVAQSIVYEDQQGGKPKVP